MDSTTDERRKIEQLWKSHADAVQGYAVFRIGRDAAEDVTMETFVVAWRRIQEVPTDALPWLLGVARNVIRNFERGARRHDDLRARLRDAAEVAGGHESDPPVDVLDALQQLAPADQELLLATAWYDLTAKAGGRMFGCTATAFSVRLYRARRRAQRALRQTSNGPVITESSQRHQSSQEV